MINGSAAPGAIESVPATSGTVAATPAAPGFDAILMLQNFAGTGEMLDDASLEAGDTADLIGLDDAEDDEDTSDDLEASLAFLSALIAATGRNAPGDFSAGAGGQGSAGEGGFAAAPGQISGDFLEAAAQALAGSSEDGELAAGLAALQGEGLESAGDAGQVNRAAEMLAQLQRSGAAESEKPVVATHVRDSRWANDFSNRVTVMVRGGESTASLQLTPVDMGPVDVNVNVRDGQATIHFGASQADTRALLEASLPRLREMLESQGFNLLDASVSSGFSRSQQQAFTQGRGDALEAETIPSETRTTRSLGLLDLYA
jgi:flagellar hook-length control protein FliK